MKLHEYQGMDLFSKYGIPHPPYHLVSSVEELVYIKNALTFPVVVKAQVLVGGRGKAGGVLFAKDFDELKKVVDELLHKKIKGKAVRKVLIAPKVNVEREYYLGITLDRRAKAPVVIISEAGGVDIEELAKTSPDKIITFHPYTTLELMPFEIREVAKKLGFPKEDMPALADIAAKLYRLFREKDALLAEINPLARVDGKLMALDSVVIIDDNALYRHPELPSAEDEEKTQLEKEAEEAGIAFVELDGDIGVVGCGAGIVMASMDLITYFGGRPASFMDLGGGATKDKTVKALEILNKKQGIRSIFMNIFGGITKCDEIAKAIVEFLKKTPDAPPVVVRLIGTNDDIGRKILADNGIKAYMNMEKAAKKAVEIAYERRGQ
ncbi:ADP-forming succinate--CoA ligase subunit beta [bacterium 3DAC]|nr:ADP-forming succinate--CoA ligase subunit beta [Dictyoglomota bacterium]UZN22796.1 ADP-forming succinate--CoA ligase subunit beta [bacterium 3DAC]